MKTVLLFLALLAGCARLPPPAVTCPGPVPVPAALHKHESVGVLEIRVELAREKERDRAKRCAAAVKVLTDWARGKK